MDLTELVYLTRQPFSSLLQERLIFGKLFHFKHLPFTMQAQTQTNWCWAATATSVSKYYWFLSPWTQCKVANSELGHSDCCSSPVPGACNVPWYLNKSLTRCNNFVSITVGQASFEQVRGEIDAGRPVGARIGWNGGGGHFLVIYGYSKIGMLEFFDIDDPIYGKSHLPVIEFANNYQASGSWTHTYFTKTYSMPIKLHYTIPSELLRRKIWDLRPLLKLKNDSAWTGTPHELAEDADASTGLAQRVYTLELGALTSNNAVPQPVGLRVYETEGDGPTAFFDFSEDDSARLMQMSAAKSHLEPYTQAVKEALAMTGADDQVYEPRLLRIPALNFEALWLHGDAPDKDKLVPLRAAGSLAALKPVPFADALGELREAAIPLAKMDSTMGA